MKVHGVEITREQLAAAETVMARHRFTFSEVRAALERTGVPRLNSHTEPRAYFISDRATDRLIQKARKAGKIRQASEVWTWVQVGAKP